jgi:hypothetical protein
MGQEIDKTHFSSLDFEEFQTRLRTETELLRQAFEQGTFDQQEEDVGFELEAWLVDSAGLPAPMNESFLQKVDHPHVVPELSRFNVEVNSSPHPLGRYLLQDLRAELEELFRICREGADALKSHVAFIGILPTVRPEMLTLEHISPLNRFYALNEQILRLRGGRPFHLDIHGADHLVLTHGDVMLESAATSLQIHLQADAKKMVRTFNAAVLIAAPMVALAANSPYLFQKDLWDETRIPLFEQAIDLEEETEKEGFSLGRVSFGSGYIRRSLLECYEENLKKFPVLLPIRLDSPPEKFQHLHLHNGTIWRWNRPIVDMGADGRPHLRLEHRVPAAGPTVVDIIAHIAFYLGLAEEIGSRPQPLEDFISFAKARENFYSAARQGLAAKVHWSNGQRVALDHLILQQLLPWAKAGLERIGVDSAASQYFLQEILAQRVASGRNGAAWQRSFVSRHGPDFSGLTQVYLENQERGRPVHLWE